MTDQVEAELKSLGTQALQDLMNNLTQAKGFVLEQAPEFCQQLVTRGMWMPAFVAIATGITVLVLIVATAWIVRLCKRDVISVDGACFCAAWPVIGAIIMSIVSLHHLYKSVAVYIAPKVFLVEEIARMLK